MHRDRYTLVPQDSSSAHILFPPYSVVNDTAVAMKKQKEERPTNAMFVRTSLNLENLLAVR